MATGQAAHPPPLATWQNTCPSSYLVKPPWAKRPRACSIPNVLARWGSGRCRYASRSRKMVPVPISSRRQASNPQAPSEAATNGTSSFTSLHHPQRRCLTVPPVVVACVVPTFCELAILAPSKKSTPRGVHGHVRDLAVIPAARAGLRQVRVVLRRRLVHRAVWIQLLPPAAGHATAPPALGVGLPMHQPGAARAGGHAITKVLGTSCAYSAHFEGGKSNRRSFPNCELSTQPSCSHPA